MKSSTRRALFTPSPTRVWIGTGMTVILFIAALYLVNTTVTTVQLQCEVAPQLPSFADCGTQEHIPAGAYWWFLLPAVSGLATTVIIAQLLTRRSASAGR